MSDIDVKKAMQLTIDIAYDYMGYLCHNKDEVSYFHLVEMNDIIQNSEMSVEKANRWLGWAQCAIVAFTPISIETMKQINKDCRCSSDG